MTMHYDKSERQLAVARRKWRSMVAKKRKAVANAVAGIRYTPAPRPAAVSGALRMLNDYACKLPSNERLPCILPLIATAQPGIFWAGLLAQWSSCDATWSLRDELLAALIAQSRREIAERYFDDAARAFFQSLPETVKVYRGCSRRHIRELAWTTDEDVADGFAYGHRGILVDDPVVASAFVSKRDIFFVAVERNESEVVVDPARLTQLAWRQASKSSQCR